MIAAPALSASQSLWLLAVECLAVVALAGYLLWAGRGRDSAKRSEDIAASEGVINIVIEPIDLEPKTLAVAKRTLTVLKWNALFLDNVKDADENQAAQDYIYGLFPELRGPND